MKHRTTTMEGKFTRYHGVFFSPPRPGQQTSFLAPSSQSFNWGGSPLRVLTWCMCVYFISICQTIKAYSLVCYPQEGTKNQSARLIRLTSIPSLPRAPSASVQVLRLWFSIFFWIFPPWGLPLFCCYKLKYPIKKILPPPLQTFFKCFMAVWFFQLPSTTQNF